MEKPKFRASGIGHLMTEPKLKADKDAGNLSEGAKTHCIDVWTSWKYKRNEEVYSKYLEKGNELEEDGITLVSLETGVFYKKNTENLSNDWITGTPDLYIGRSINEAEFIEDIKSSWDVFTFQRARNKPLNQMYYWQLQSYMWLTGAKESRLRYCLLNATPDLILDEIRKLSYAMRLMPGEETPEFKYRAAKIERNMIYDLNEFVTRYPNFDLYSPKAEWKYDIPRSERLHTIVVPRDEKAIEQIKFKVEKAWEFMANL